MTKKKGGKTAAVINIGSNRVRMLVSQLKKGEVSPVDLLEHPIALGHEVFSTGKVSFETLRELSSILRGFSNVLKEYNVDSYCAVATTALREAQNKAFVLDQLKLQNNLTVKILEDNQEKALIFSDIFESLRSTDAFQQGNSLVTHIGTGTIGFSLYDGVRVTFSQNIPLGVLKLYDKLGGLQDETESFYTVAAEYVDLIIQHISTAFPQNSFPVKNLVLTGNEIRAIAALCGVKEENETFLLSSKQVKALFKELRALSAEKISLKLGITEESAKLLYSSLAIYVQLIRFTKAETIIAPKSDLCSTLVRSMLLPKSQEDFHSQVRINALSCARSIAAGYKCNLAHSDQVGRFACRIFDKMKKAHGLDLQGRLILELAAILHDCGYYVNSKEHLTSTFNLIQNMDIYGITDEEMSYVAYAVRCSSYEPYHSEDYDENLYELSDETQLLVSKITAMFRLADALDKSQKQKLSDIRVKLDEHRLIITAESNENTLLEKWAFQHCASFFTDVFGIAPELLIKPLSLKVH